MTTKLGLPTIVAFLAAMSLAGAAGIVTWKDGDTLTHTDVNNNFTHIHSNMVGGGGSHAALVNADVSRNARIAHSKFATPGLFPKMLYVVTEVDGGACVANGPGTLCSAFAAAPGGTEPTISHDNTGVYDITWSHVRATTQYHVTAQAHGRAGFYDAAECHPSSMLDGGVTIRCYITYNADGGLTPNLADVAFDLMVMDNNS